MVGLVLRMLDLQFCYVAWPEDAVPLPHILPATLTSVPDQVKPTGWRTAQGTAAESASWALPGSGEPMLSVPTNING